VRIDLDAVRYFAAAGGTPCNRAKMELDGRLNFQVIWASSLSSEIVNVWQTIPTTAPCSFRIGPPLEPCV
jgi:hypothetical protein